METLRERIETMPLHVDKPVYQKLDISKTPDRDPNPSLYGYPTRQGWRMEFRLGVEFFCTGAEKDSAFVNAEKLILQKIHSDSLRHIVAIKNAIYSGDELEALALLDEMRKTFGM